MDIPFVPSPEDLVYGSGDAFGSRTSWLVALFTGHKIYKQRTHSLLNMVEMATRWKFWTSLFMIWVPVWWVGTALLAYSATTYPMPTGSKVLAVVIPAIFFVTIYFSLGIVFVRLCVQSAFKITWIFKPCRAPAVWLPNVSPLWWYMAPFMPLIWGVVYVRLEMLGVL